MHDHTTLNTPNEIPYGFCRCGCGQKTTVYARTDKRTGSVKGQPRPYLNGHRKPSEAIAARRSNQTLEEAFRSRFTQGEPEQCWEWHGYTNKTGYGKLTYRGKTYRANRLAWQFHSGKPIPKNDVICHRCDNRRCVNPLHLWLDTQSGNMTDKTNKGRQHRGEVHPATSLTADKVRQIRSLKQQGKTSGKSQISLIAPSRMSSMSFVEIAGRILLSDFHH